MWESTTLCGLSSVSVEDVPKVLGLSFISSGVVCVAMSRWKTSVGSDVIDSVSSSSSLSASFSDRGRAGIFDTLFSSFSFKVDKLVKAVSASWCLASPSDLSMGFTRNSLAP